MTRFLLAVTGAGLALAGAAFSGVQAAQTAPPPVLIESLAGVDSFARYCAPCHGTAGRGDGPVGAALKTRPADLTQLARRNDGAFPRTRIADYVAGTGRPIAAHGTSEMPIWGPLFRTFESDTRAGVRLENLVAYVESLQAPTSAVHDPGAELFRTHCAVCHGRSGRGDGPLVGQLRVTPPDLTKFTQRNGGVFPSERVYRIIDGRDVPSHGDREMPIWGDAFRNDARTQAIVRFLEAIQERAAE